MSNDWSDVLLAQPEETNVVKLLMEDPLSETTRRHRKALLLTSLVLIAIHFGVKPTSFQAIGILVTGALEPTLITGLRLALGYFLVSFVVFALRDFWKWRSEVILLMGWWVSKYPLNTADEIIEQQLIEPPPWPRLRVHDKKWLIAHARKQLNEHHPQPRFLRFICGANRAVFAGIGLDFVVPPIIAAVAAIASYWVPLADLVLRVWTSAARVVQNLW